MLHPLSILILVTLVMLAITGFRQFFAKVIFNPRRQHKWVPTRPKRDLMLDGKIHIWDFNDFPGRPVIIYYHGTFGNISYYEPIVLLTQRIELNLILCDYQGYGMSTGNPSTRQIIEDAELVYCYAAKHYPSMNIVMWGESLGTFPAIDLATRCQIRALVVMSGFSSLEKMAEDPHHHWPIRMIGKALPVVKLDIPNWKTIENVECPVVVLHSSDDKFIPPAHAQQLYEHIKHEQKTLILIKGTHRRPIIGMHDLIQLLARCGISIKGDCSDILRRIAHESATLE